MEQTVITVAGIAPPAPGKKQGKIHDTNGGSWNVWGDKLQNYRLGVSYEIHYEPSEFNGHQFNVIKTCSPVNLNPQQQTMPLKPPHDGWPGPVPQVKAQYQSTEKDKIIYVCAYMKACFQNSNVNPFELTFSEMMAQQDKFIQLWRNSFGKAQHDTDLNDEIPDFK